MHIAEISHSFLALISSLGSEKRSRKWVWAACRIAAANSVQLSFKHESSKTKDQAYVWVVCMLTVWKIDWLIVLLFPGLLPICNVDPTQIPTDRSECQLFGNSFRAESFNMNYGYASAWSWCRVEFLNKIFTKTCLYSIRNQRTRAENKFREWSWMMLILDFDWLTCALVGLGAAPSPISILARCFLHSIWVYAKPSQHLICGSYLKGPLISLLKCTAEMSSCLLYERKVMPVQRTCRSPWKMFKHPSPQQLRCPPCLSG